MMRLLRTRQSDKKRVMKAGLTGLFRLRQDATNGLQMRDEDKPGEEESGFAQLGKKL